MAKKKSRLLSEVREAAQDLRDIGAIDITTMRKFDMLCLPEVPRYSAADIKRIRKASRASQGVFAAYLNVSSQRQQGDSHGVGARREGAVRDGTEAPQHR